MEPAKFLLPTKETAAVLKCPSAWMEAGMHSRTRYRERLKLLQVARADHSEAGTGELATFKSTSLVTRHWEQLWQAS